MLPQSLSPPSTLHSLEPVLGSISILGAISNMVIEYNHLTPTGIQREVSGETVR